MKVNKSYEIADAKISFVSLVNKAANKRKFLIMKQEQEVGNMELKKVLKNGRTQITEEELDLLVDAIADRVIEKLADDDGDSETCERCGANLVPGERCRCERVAIGKSAPHYLHGIL